jgi:hypothetical protein
MTDAQRSAASECIRLMALLAESTTPGSKDLARIVARRLREIADRNAPARALTDTQIAPWLEIARQL